MRAVRKLCVLLLGSVLFIAGFLKLMDHVGAGLVVAEYYKFFHMGFLATMSHATGVSLALFETLLGAAVMTGIWKRDVAIVSGLVLIFFTVLTFILWVFNPSMDCGCFGEAVHLTHFQSLLKNFFLLFFWAMAYLPMDKLRPAGGIKYVGFAVTAVSVALFTLWSLLSIPPIDFTPMAPGEELMNLDEGYVEGAPVLSFSDVEGGYADSLATGGRVLVVSSYDPVRISDKNWERISAFVEDAGNRGYTTLVLAASTPDEVGYPATDSHLFPNLYFADRRELMTLNRSNGGLTFINDGQIVRKWAMRSLPDGETLDGLAVMDSTEAVIEGNNPQRLRVQAFLLYAFAVMLLL